MKYIRWAVSWTLYGIGHFAFLLIDRWGVIPGADDDEPGRLFIAVHGIYQRAMFASSSIQLGELGPWGLLDVPQGESRDG